MPDSEEGIFIPIHLDDSALDREGEQVKEKVGRIADDVERRSRRSVAQRPSSLQGQGGGLGGMLGGGGGVLGAVGLATGIGGISSLVTTLLQVTGIAEELGKQFTNLTESGAKLFGIETERAAQERRRIEQLQEQFQLAATEDPRARAELQFQAAGRDITGKLEAEDISEAEAFQLRIAAQQRREQALRGILRQEATAGAALLGQPLKDFDTAEEFAALNRAIDKIKEDRAKMLRAVERLAQTSTPEGLG